MKLAQEVRAGNVIMVGKDPMVVQKAEFSKSGRNASVVKMKLKNLLSGSGTETDLPRRREVRHHPARQEGSDVLVLRRPDVRLHGQRVQPVRRREGQPGRRAQLPRGRARLRAHVLRRARDLGRAAELGRPRDHVHRARGQGRHVGQGDEAREARQRLRGAGPAVRHAPATRSRSTRAPASTAAASRSLLSLPAKGAPRGARSCLRRAGKPRIFDTSGRATPRWSRIAAVLPMFRCPGMPDGGAQGGLSASATERCDYAASGCSRRYRRASLRGLR